MTDQQRNKRVIRAFMQAHYTDERLAQLLAHAQDGKLDYVSCCCFIGIVTADHALRGYIQVGSSETRHLQAALLLDGAEDAENAFLNLPFRNTEEESVISRAEYVEARRRILIPMIRAEMRRRSKAKAERNSQVAEPFRSIINAISTEVPD